MYPIVALAQHITQMIRIGIVENVDYFFVKKGFVAMIT